MGVLRLGFIDSILSAPVLAGFIQAEAFILIVEQAPRLIGIKPCPATEVITTHPI
jgi:MFS superfamily sulfate permease-like transporter